MGELSHTTQTICKITKKYLYPISLHSQSLNTNTILSLWSTNIVGQIQFYLDPNPTKFCKPDKDPTSFQKPGSDPTAFHQTNHDPTKTPGYGAANLVITYNFPLLNFRCPPEVLFQFYIQEVYLPIFLFFFNLQKYTKSKLTIIFLLYVQEFMSIFIIMGLLWKMDFSETQ